MSYREYLSRIAGLLEQMEERESESIEEAAQLLGETVLADGLIYAFGSGHSQCLAREVAGRAGGLFTIQGIADPLKGRGERVEGLAEELLKAYPLKSGETMIVISNSGRNAMPIEMALGAQQRGLKVIGVTSLKHSSASESRHSSGKRLFEIADVVLDTGGPLGDAVIELGDTGLKIGAVSTVLGAALLNATVVAAIEYVRARGKTPPILVSFNVDGSDEHNARVMEQYGKRMPDCWGIQA